MPTLGSPPSRPDRPPSRDLQETFHQVSGLSLKFLKVDVEGFESRVIRGGADTIHKFRPIIMVEYLGLSLAQNLSLTGGLQPLVMPFAASASMANPQICGRRHQ